MLEDELREYLKSQGASLVGFADLSRLAINPAAIDPSNPSDRAMPWGIAFGMRIRPEIVTGINGGPTKEYYDEYVRLNQALDRLGLSCAEYITRLGYHAMAQTTTHAADDDSLTTPLPHKTVATRAGLGWIGKNALLITPEYGSALRLSSIITDMPLTANKPIDESSCGKCMRCTEACPATAIKGQLWQVGVSREELVEPFKCQKTAKALTKERIGFEITICGKCFEVCPYTRRYLKASGQNAGL